MLLCAVLPKQFISLALAFCLLFALCVPASAAVNVPNGTFSSNYFSSYGVVLGDAGSHRLCITFSTDGIGICDELGVSTFQVEKKITGDDGTTYWANVGSFSGQTGHNVSSYTYSVNFQGVGGETYRVRATFMCTKTINGVVGTEFKTTTTGGKKIN